MKVSVDLSILFNETIETLKSHGQLIGIYLAIVIPTAAVSAIFEADTSTGSPSPLDGLMFLQSLFPQDSLELAILLAQSVISLMAFYWLIAGMLAHSKSPKFDRFLPFVGILCLSTLVMIGGFLLLIIPGLILAVRWVPLFPLVISRENRGMESLGESWKLTEGSGWPIFGAIVIFFLIDLVVVGVISGLGEALSPTLAAIHDAFGSALIAAFSVAVFRLLDVGGHVRAEERD